MVIRGSLRVISLNIVTAITILVWLSPVNAQLNSVIDRAFDEILINRIRFTPGPHGLHFIPAAKAASGTLSPALNSFIADNITSFPIPTPVPYITFRMFSGRPIEKTNSLGPIFAESAETVGKGLVNIGMSFSYLSLNKIRGFPTKDLKFIFTHIDASGDGTLGDHPAESDIIDLFLDLDVNASISALVATIGISNALDIGAVIPLIAIDMEGNATASINSFSLENLGIALHRFNEDESNPILTTMVPFDESSFGIGAITLKLKYNFLRRFNMNAAALLEVLLPTGKKEDFRGTGKANYKLSVITEQKTGGFASHVNIAFNKRTVGFQNDRIEFIVGMEQRILERLNFVFDFIGAYEIRTTSTFKFPGETIIYDRIAGVVQSRQIDLSNIPNRENDNMLNTSFGFRCAPSEKIAFLGNVLIPLNDGGLRSSFVPTVGFSINF